MTNKFISILLLANGTDYIVVFINYNCCYPFYVDRQLAKFKISFFVGAARLPIGLILLLMDSYIYYSVCLLAYHRDRSERFRFLRISIELNKARTRQMEQTGKNR